MSESYLPQFGTDIDVQTDFSELENPGYTFGIDFENNRIIGKTDRLGAVYQAVKLILGTQRYKYPIYSYNYGVELSDLFGKPCGFVKSELPGRITEALTQDDRITDVCDFEFTKEKRKLTVGFTVKTIYGDIKQSTEVII